METSVLTSTKKVLGLDKNYTAFDLDVITHINSAFSVLCQLGIGPAVGFSIEDSYTDWDEFIDNETILNMVKPYVYLKVRMAFDPPTTSFVIDAMNKQIAELEGRLSLQREWLLNPVDPATLTQTPEEENLL